MSEGVCVELFDRSDDSFLEGGFEVGEGRKGSDGGPCKMEPSGEVSPQQYHN